MDGVQNQNRQLVYAASPPDSGVRWGSATEILQPRPTRLGMETGRQSVAIRGSAARLVPLFFFQPPPRAAVMATSRFHLLRLPQTCPLPCILPSSSSITSWLDCCKTQTRSPLPQPCSFPSPSSTLHPGSHSKDPAGWHHSLA